MRPSLWLAGLFATLMAAPAGAQRLTEPWVPGAASLRTSASSVPIVRIDSEVVTATPGGRAFAALLGGAVGFVGGGIVGYHLRIHSPSDDLGLEGAAWGAVIGESLGMVAAATLASPSQSRTLDWIAVPAIAVGGIALASATNHGEVLLLVPVAQIYELLSGRPEPSPSADAEGPPSL